MVVLLIMLDTDNAKFKGHKHDIVHMTYAQQQGSCYDIYLQNKKTWEQQLFLFAQVCSCNEIANPDRHNAQP